MVSRRSRSSSDAIRKLNPGPLEEMIFFDHPSGRADPDGDGLESSQPARRRCRHGCDFSLGKSKFYGAELEPAGEGLGSLARNTRVSKSASRQPALCISTKTSVAAHWL